MGKKMEMKKRGKRKEDQTYATSDQPHPFHQGDDQEEICRLKSLLAKEFEIKDLGNLRYFLRMEVETDMTGCKPTETPVDPSHRLGAELGGVLVDKGRYQRLVGRLIWLSHI
ncbi:hypothetical protein CK203_092622 [Vitis vinifera]|uniref:Reverse transcriptase Ty1/copia-type domain-containing protein n=1 Tax=Vitis vinifera TaxID=29760 RepID=A0A438BUS8_VITVI|nr:hypothetical protein CK203_092622 [Vitis vinifera]